jgi:OmpA-OmpF porin, OOP family
MTSFLDEASSLITPELLGKAAAAFGVPADGVQKAIGAAIPTVLGSIASRSGEAGFINDLFQMVTHSSAGGSASGAAMSAIESMVGGGHSPLVDMSKKLLGGLFGGSGDSVMSAIGRMAGLGTSGSGIMGTVGALAISMLGNRVRAGGLSPAALGGALLGERNALMAAVPASIAGLLGDRKAAAAPVAAAARGGVARASSGAPDNIFVGFVALVGAGLLAWYAMSRGKPAPTPEPVAIVAPAPTAPAMPGATLPGGAAIQFADGGIESQLLAFIQDSTKPVDKTTWFEFDRLLFETGSATLQPTSFDQLNNIAEILKAYPAVSLKLGGYTDNVGRASANMKLSADRANTAIAELVKLGIANTRLTAEGYGDTVPVADNTTEEGRAKNRRTAARVTAK